jgi:arginyl-tRNA synthetase
VIEEIDEGTDISYMVAQYSGTDTADYVYVWAAKQHLHAYRVDYTAVTI